MLMDANNAAHTRTLSHYAADEYTLKVLSQVLNENLMHYLWNIKRIHRREKRGKALICIEKDPSELKNNKNGKFV